MIYARITFPIILAFGLGACHAPSPPANGLSDAAARAQTQRLLAMDPDTVRGHLAGTTTRSFIPVHGTQIVYHAPNGRSFLWYPGNRTAVPARWEVRAPPPPPLNTGRSNQNPTNSKKPATPP